MDNHIHLQRSDLLRFFVHHLNEVFAAKTHLLTHLPEMLYETYSPELEEGIFETIRIVEQQRDRLKAVYMLLDSPIEEISASKGLQGLVNDSFEEIRTYRHNPELRDMSILFYLASIESVEMASFQVLQLLAVKIRNEEVSRLIKENYDDAQTDKTLMLLITAKYISHV